MRPSIVVLLVVVVALVGCGSPATNQQTSLPTWEPTPLALTSEPPVAPATTSPAVEVPQATPVTTPGPSNVPAVTPAPVARPPESPEITEATPRAAHDPSEPMANASWAGRYSVYRPHTFSAQKTNLLCVPTTIQMMLNLIRGESDHSRTNQIKYYKYAQAHSRYPLKDNGADAAGWAAALNHWGADGYRVGVSNSRQDALWLAAKRMRKTGRPVGMIVWGSSGTGGHAWVMTGFRSTDDPRVTDNYKVTGVQAMGPLWPLGTINGKPYDPGPKEWVGMDELRRKFTRFRYRPAPAWDGRWITVLP